MSRLLHILTGIHRLEGALADSESYLLENPNDINFLAAAVSSKKLLDRRRAEFSAMAKEHKSDLVHYTVYGGKTRSVPHIRDICGTFMSFENAVLLTAQSTLMAEPQRTRYIEDPVADAALRYGYLFSERENQLGIVAATRGETQMHFDLAALNQITPGHPKRLQYIPDSVLKESALEVFAVAQAKRAQQIADFAQKRGTAVVSEINDWCRCHTHALLDVEAAWGESKISLQATAHQLDNVASMIAMLSNEVKRDVIARKGQFYSINRKTRHFGFETEDKKRLTGTFPKNLFDDKRPAKMPKMYEVFFAVASRYNEALGRDITTHEVMDIKEI